MKLNSQIPAPILPNPEQSSVLELGLTPCSKPNWLAIDEDFAHFHAHKLQQFETHPDEVFAALPQSVAAQEEFSQVLLEDLLTNHAARQDSLRGCVRYAVNNDLETADLFYAWDLLIRAKDH